MASRTSAKRSGSPGTTVAWFTIEDLGLLDRRRRADDSITRVLARLIRTDLITIDDIGMLRVSPDAAGAFCRLVDAAYERRALAVSSNLHPSDSTRSCPKPWPPRPSTGSAPCPRGHHQW
ncbi:ATP-binding protein [Saccharopolyspora shandongensis]|uniref:ATP-binding protein n=1 Tax=Saccharopolyspora shandongensis TaxID=418495 RepID=UPI00342DA33E